MPISWVCHKSTVSGMPCVSSEELISGWDTPAQCQLSRIPGRHINNWEPAYSLVKDAISGAEIAVAPHLSALAVACLPLCLVEERGRGESGGEGPICQFSFGIYSVLCSVSVPGCTLVFHGKVFIIFFLSMIPWSGLLSHVSSLRFFWGQSGRSWP